MEEGRHGGQIRHRGAIDGIEHLVPGGERFRADPLEPGAHHHELTRPQLAAIGTRLMDVREADLLLRGHGGAISERQKYVPRGLIVNISSGSAKVGLPLRLPYVVSKGAVISMTMSLARELGPHGIRVNAILPGAIRGARIERVIREKAQALRMSPEDYEQSLLRFISLRTMVDPEDIAAMILFLACAAGRRITGQAIGVDGNIEYEE